jgi:hypothetical protein
MKPFFKNITSVTAAAVMALCSFNAGFYAGADDEIPDKCVVHYDLSGEGIIIPEDKDGNPQSIEDIETDPNSSVYVTNVIPEREGYIFSCWTADNIAAYPAGTVMRVGTENVDLHPVWIDEEDENFHKVTFRVEKNGEIDEEAEKYVPAQNALKGRYILIPSWKFTQTGYDQKGWTDGVHEFEVNTYILVGDEDIILRPNLKKIYKLKYSAGDYEGIVGASFQEYELAESFPTSLQSADRFSRIGYEIKNWHCITDGKDYEPNAVFIMPGSDVLIEPNWSPLRYTVVFSADKNNVKVPGYTGTAITAPECPITKEGYTFGGWQYGDETVQAGEEYTIKGAAPGLGIRFTAIWNEAGSDVTTTTVTDPVTTTTTTVTETTTTTVTETTTTTVTETTTTSAPSETTTTTSAPVSDIAYGDSNCDEKVELADAILLMQSIANPDKYGVEGSDAKHLTRQGANNGDVDKSVVGITSGDALMIQEFLLKKIDTLVPAEK